MKTITISCALTLMLVTTSAYATNVTDTLLAQFQQQGAGPFSASAGQSFWQQDHNGRSCTLCHTADVTQAGEHAKTGKRIEPMAPSVNPERLTDQAQVEKWLLRNCRWVLERECTPQEKGDVLVWLSQQ